MAIAGCGGRRRPIGWRPGGVANTEIDDRYVYVFGHKGTAGYYYNIPDFGHWFYLYSLTRTNTS